MAGRKGRNLEREVKELRQAVCRAIQRTYPTRQFGAMLMLGCVFLGVTEQEVRRAVTIEKRRRKTHVFDERKRAVQQGLATLWSLGNRRPAQQRWEQETASQAAVS
jgi:hypothetical protein